VRRSTSNGPVWSVWTALSAALYCQQADINDRRHIFSYVLQLVGLGSNADSGGSTKDGIDTRREDDTSYLVKGRGRDSINLVTFPLICLNASQRSDELGNELVQL